MELRDAEALARSIMSEYGLDTWRFAFDRSKRRFGRCQHATKTITLSRYLVPLNERDEVEDTIRHEVAHALVGISHGHDRVWKLKCIEVGARPQRCYDAAKVVTPPAAYVLACDSGCEIKRQRRPRGKYACRRHHLELTVTAQ